MSETRTNGSVREMLRVVLVSLLVLSCAPAAQDPERPPIEVRAPGPSPAASASHPAPAASVAAGDTLQATCDGGDLQACVRLANRCGLVGADSTDVPWASAACAERERKACDLGSAEMCRHLGDRHSDVTIDDAGVKKDASAAIKLIDRACELGEIDSCIQMAFRYEDGVGVTRNVPHAVELFQRACDEDGGIFPQPCQALARHLATGDGIAKDLRRAAGIHVATCRQGACDADALIALCSDAGGKQKTNDGCVAYALMLVTTVAGVPEYNPTKAKSLLERACRRKDAAGCLVLATWHRDGREFSEKVKIPADPSRASHYTKQACAAGDDAACKQL